MRDHTSSRRSRRPILKALGAWGGIGVLGVVAALILLPVPVIWFTRWLPWSLIVRVGLAGNRFGPPVLVGLGVGLLAWDAERVPVRRRRKRVGGAGPWAVSAGVLFTLLVGVILWARP